MAAKKSDKGATNSSDAKSKATNNENAEPNGYAEALSELESILTKIDNPTVDVDALAQYVARASFLVSWCQERIAAAQFSIDEIVATLEADGDIDSDDIDSDEDDDYDDEDYADDDDDDDDD